MTLTAFDWMIVLVSIVVSFVPAIVLAKRAARVLESFYALVRPAGPGWKLMRDRTGLPASGAGLAVLLARIWRSSAAHDSKKA